MDRAFEPTAEERMARDRVVDAVLKAVRSDERIKLPDSRRSSEDEAANFALQTVGLAPNAFGGTVGPYRYQFEGEDDLLHVFVLRHNGSPLTPEEGQRVFSFLLPDLPSALVWLKPGEFSQHFYFGHDELLNDAI